MREQIANVRRWKIYERLKRKAGNKDNAESRISFRKREERELREENY